MSLPPLLRATAITVFLASVAHSQGNSPGNRHVPGTSANPSATPPAPAPGRANPGSSPSTSTAADVGSSPGSRSNSPPGQSNASNTANGRPDSNKAPSGKAADQGGSGNSAASPSPHTPNPHASSSANAIQSLLQKFDNSRDKIVMSRQALIDKLGAAKTDAERQGVLAELRADQQIAQEEQRATAKEIRAELQNLRRQRGAH